MVRPSPKWWSTTTDWPLSLSHLLSRRRISVFGHVARLDDDTPANMALQLHISVSLNRPPDRTWHCAPGRPWNKWLDQLRNNSIRPHRDLCRHAVDRGHGGATTWQPSPATWRWLWWVSVGRTVLAEANPASTMDGVVTINVHRSFNFFGSSHYSDRCDRHSFPMPSLPPMSIYGDPQKRENTVFHKKGDNILMVISLSNLNRYSNSFTGWFASKFAVSRLLKVPPHLAYVATLLWNINVRKQATNDKLQGSEVTYLRCGGTVNNQIKTGLLLSLSAKKI